MIRISVTMAIFCYVTFALAAIFVLWVFSERKAALPKFVREKADVWECSICAYTYVDSTHQEISQCPQCKSFNKKDPEDRLL